MEATRGYRVYLLNQRKVCSSKHVVFKKETCCFDFSFDLDITEESNIEILDGESSVEQLDADESLNSSAQVGRELRSRETLRKPSRY